MISGTPFFSITARANSSTLLFDLYKNELKVFGFSQGFQTRSGVLTRGGERVKGSEVQPGRTGVQPDR